MHSFIGYTGYSVHSNDNWQPKSEIISLQSLKSQSRLWVINNDAERKLNTTTLLLIYYGMNDIKYLYYKHLHITYWSTSRGTCWVGLQCYIAYSSNRLFVGEKKTPLLTYKCTISDDPYKTINCWQQHLDKWTCLNK